MWLEVTALVGDLWTIALPNCHCLMVRWIENVVQAIEIVLCRFGAQVEQKLWNNIQDGTKQNNVVDNTW